MWLLINWGQVDGLFQNHYESHQHLFQKARILTTTLKNQHWDSFPEHTLRQLTPDGCTGETHKIPDETASNFIITCPDNQTALGALPDLISKSPTGLEEVLITANESATQITLKIGKSHHQEI